VKCCNRRVTFESAIKSRKNYPIVAKNLSNHNCMSAPNFFASISLAVTPTYSRSRTSLIPARALRCIASVVANQRVGPCNSRETRHFFPILCKNLSPPVKSLFNDSYAAAIGRQSSWSSETRRFSAIRLGYCNNIFYGRILSHLYNYCCSFSNKNNIIMIRDVRKTL